MQDLERTANELKERQISLKLRINEKNTANILAAMFSADAAESSKSTADVRVEEILKRPTEGIPDASKIPELPALVLPGHHNNGKRVLSSSLPNSNGFVTSEQRFPDDGIDYALLAKDRSTCTPAELDMIRRERNRMHAKRTRDRKKRFMDKMQGIIEQLQDENEILSCHLRTLSKNCVCPSGDTTPSLASPKVEACSANVSALVSLNEDDSSSTFNNEQNDTAPASEISDCVSSHSKLPPKKRQCFGNLNRSNVPTSITTTKHFNAAAAVS